MLMRVKSTHDANIIDQYLCSYMGEFHISSTIQSLAESVFDEIEFVEVQIIARAFKSSKEERKLATRQLRELVPTRPKRPLYYVNHELGFLPGRSRFVVEQTGSYLDLLVKELRFELEGNYYSKPLGVNIASLMKRVDSDFQLVLRKIELFNELAYVPSKHKYGPPNERKHYFDSQEAVIIVLAGVKLGEELKRRSQFVRNLCQDVVLPAQKPLLGNWKRDYKGGEPFDFKEKLADSVKGLRPE